MIIRYVKTLFLFWTSRILSKALSFLFLLGLLLICTESFCQVPKAINYSYQVLDTTGNPSANQNISLRFSYFEFNVFGSPKYQESFSTETDENGVIVLLLGTGSPIFNSFDSINWANAPVHLKTEIDSTGGTNYELLGVDRFLPSPYTYYAQYGADEDADSTNEHQNLLLHGDTLSISSGNSVVLSLDGDDLGTHSANQNIVLGNFWLSGDGDNEGVLIDSTGTINTSLIQISSGHYLFSEGSNSGFGARPDAAALYNTVFGISAGNDLLTGYNNSLYGYRSGQNLSGGNNNILIGSHAGRMIREGVANVAVGVGAGEHNESGVSNTYLGDQAGKNSTSSYNTLVGKSAGYSLEGGSSNVFVGINAGAYNKAGHNNVFVGRNAGLNETGSNRLYIDNSETSSPLIYGEFDNDLLRINGNLDVSGNILLNGYSLTFDGDSTNEFQSLSLTDRYLSISNGNTVVLPEEIDGDSTNEFQSLSLTDRYLSISNGNTVVLPEEIDGDSTNEFQSLSLTDRNLSISNGNTVVLPEEIDGDPTNEIQTIIISGDSLSISGGNTVIIPTSASSNSEVSIDIGTFTLSPNAQGDEITISHDLGVVPNLFELNWFSHGQGPRANYGNGTYNGNEYATVLGYVPNTPWAGYQNSQLVNSSIIFCRSDQAGFHWSAIVIEMTASHIKLQVNSFGHQQTVRCNWKAFK